LKLEQKDMQDDIDNP